MADEEQDDQEEQTPHPSPAQRGESGGARDEWDKRRTKPGTRKGNWPTGGDRG